MTGLVLALAMDL